MTRSKAARQCLAFTLGTRCEARRESGLYCSRHAYWGTTNLDLSKRALEIEAEDSAPDTTFDRARYAIAIAQRNHDSDFIEVDTDATDCYHDGRGIWVRAWIRVDESAIDQYCESCGGPCRDES